MSEPARVFENCIVPGEGRVEWFDDDGRSEVEIFTGPTARRQALRYAMQKYGAFREVQLEPARASRDVNRMVAAAINADTRWFWHGPDAWRGAREEERPLRR
jgi:hypothetical protein